MIQVESLTDQFDGGVQQCIEIQNGGRGRGDAGRNFHLNAITAECSLECAANAFLFAENDLLSTLQEALNHRMMIDVDSLQCGGYQVCLQIRKNKLTRGLVQTQYGYFAQACLAELGAMLPGEGILRVLDKTQQRLGLARSKSLQCGGPDLGPVGEQGIAKRLVIQIHQTGVLDC